MATLMTLRYGGRLGCCKNAPIWLRKSRIRTYLRRSLASQASEDSQERPPTGLFRLLGDRERRILEEQRRITEEARKLAKQVGLAPLAVDTFLQSTFCVVVAGEFNAGKSTVINALLGTKLLETGALPTTDVITLLSRDPQPVPPTMLHYTHPQLPDDWTLVDTPGTNAVVEDHTARTMRLLPSADLILFVTSADRPFPESERKLLEGLLGGPSVVIVLNKMDVLDQAGGDHGDAEKRKVLEFVEHHAGTLLGGRPLIFPVSAHRALAAKLGNVAALWKSSQFGALEQFLQETLTTDHKIRAKLASPLGVVERRMETALHRISKELDELDTDIATMNLVKNHMDGWMKEMVVDMEEVRKEYRSLLEKQAKRAQSLLRRMSWWQYYNWSVMDNEGLQIAWESTRPSGLKQGNLHDTLIELASETSDSIATRSRAQGQSVIEFLGRRPSTRNQSLVGSVTAASRFDDVRESLLRGLSEAIQRSVENSNDDTDRAPLLRLQQAATASLGLHGMSLTAALASGLQLMDLSVGLPVATAGIVAGSALSTISCRSFERHHRSRWTECQDELNEAIDEAFGKVLSRIERRIGDGVAPYRRFVETESERLQQLKQDCEAVTARAHLLRKEINETA